MDPCYWKSLLVDKSNPSGFVLICRPVSRSECSWDIIVLMFRSQAAHSSEPSIGHNIDLAYVCVAHLYTWMDDKLSYLLEERITCAKVRALKDGLYVCCAHCGRVDFSSFEIDKKSLITDLFQWYTTIRGLTPSCSLWFSHALWLHKSLEVIGSVHGLSPLRCGAITWTIAGQLEHREQAFMKFKA